MILSNFVLFVLFVLMNFIIGQAYTQKQVPRSHGWQLAL